jgi:activator of 2-hydroxyglutaryl-CoA dehydratase
MRRPVSGRDAVRSQVIDVLEAQIKRRPAMKKVSTVAAKQSRNFSEQKLTIGLDLGDRSSWYCVLDEAGAIVLEQKLGTTPKAMKEVFGACRTAASRWKRARIRPG